MTKQSDQLQPVWKGKVISTLSAIQQPSPQPLDIVADCAPAGQDQDSADGAKSPISYKVHGRIPSLFKTGSGLLK